MKIQKRLIIIGCAAALTTAVGCGDKKGEVVISDETTPKLENVNDTLNWALGYNMAQNMAGMGLELDEEILLQAIHTTLSVKQQPLTQEQMVRATSMLNEVLFANQAAVAEKTQKSEEEYFKQLMAENPKVKKADNGLYYEVMREGNGRKGEMYLVVEFDYKGMLSDGTVFDQTYGVREPITTVIGDQLIPGLREAFCMMKAGSKYKIYVPSEMAFGQRGSEDVPPNTIVIYEVEVHNIMD